MSFALELLTFLEWSLGMLTCVFGAIHLSTPILLIGISNLLLVPQLIELNEVTKKCK